MTALLPLAFFVIALFYSMAGFGGGSSYIALLAISGLPLAAIPILSLSCNLLVSGQGSLILARTGHLRLRLLAPLLLGSVPSAFLGGAWRIDSTTYLWILTSVLTLSGLALLFTVSPPDKASAPRSSFQLFLMGSLLGGLAGLSGIGGGIFLAPVLHLLKAARAREIAAAAAVFIALNSAAGLLGQLSKQSAPGDGIPTFLFIACPLAVVAGGFIGSRALSRTLPPLLIRRITAILVLLVALRLWLRLLAGL